MNRYRKTIAGLVTAIAVAAPLSMASAAPSAKSVPPTDIPLATKSLDKSFGKLGALKFGKAQPYGSGFVQTAADSTKQFGINVLSTGKTAKAADAVALVDVTYARPKVLLPEVQTLFQSSLTTIYPSWPEATQWISDTLPKLADAVAKKKENSMVFNAGTGTVTLMLSDVMAKSQATPQFVFTIKNDALMKTFQLPINAPVNQQAAVLVAAPAAATPKPSVTTAAKSNGTLPAAGGKLPAGGVAAVDANTCPKDHPIKGNASSKIYHVVGDPSYAQTKPEVCFATEADAQAAGYRAPKK